MLVSPNFVKFYLFFIFANPENFMCLASVVKKFEFWLPRLEGTPNLVPPNFISSLYLLILKISCV